MRTALSLALSCLAIVGSATDTFLPNVDVNEEVALPSDLASPQQLYLKAGEGIIIECLRKSFQQLAPSKFILIRRTLNSCTRPREDQATTPSTLTTPLSYSPWRKTCSASPWALTRTCRLRPRWPLRLTRASPSCLTQPTAIIRLLIPIRTRSGR